MDDSTAKPEDHGKWIERWLENARDDDGNYRSGNWMISLAPYFKLVGTSFKGREPGVSFTFTVQAEHCNNMGNLHGGCTATIFDFATTMALVPISRPDAWHLLGVSRTLSVTYLRPAPKGTELLIECDVVQVGRTLATLKGTMRRTSDGQITAMCEHCKVDVTARPAL